MVYEITRGDKVITVSDPETGKTITNYNLDQAERHRNQDVRDATEFTEVHWMPRGGWVIYSCWAFDSRIHTAATPTDDAGAAAHLRQHLNYTEAEAAEIIEAHR